MPKQQLVDGAERQVEHVSFSMMSATEMSRASHVHVQNSDLFQMPQRSPLVHGPLDMRMGVSDKKMVCNTCKLSMKDCAGHFGHVQLELPVFHIGFFKATIAVLHKICKHCSRVLMLDADIRAYCRRYGSGPVEALRRRELDKAVLEKCRRRTSCPHCGGINGPVKKVGPLKLIHEMYREKHYPMEEFKTQFDSLADSLKEAPYILQSNRVQEDLTPLVVFELFKNVIPSDVAALSLAGNRNNELKKKLSEGANSEMLMENWEHIQLKCALYINGEMSGLAPGQQQSKPLRGLSQRLKGKTGRFRGNLSGKRVDFSSRTVISPDPNLEIDQVAVPLHICKVLTYPERVTTHNRTRMQELVRNGPDQYPGANHLIFAGKCLEDGGGAGGAAASGNAVAGLPSAPDKVFLQYGNRSKMADELRIGDIVERHLIDGDIVLFNRQPSLHKMSIMSHRVKALPWRTFRFNVCVCNPYNADFDGDEMNLHVPQTEEARAEALELMGTKSNICTPRNGEPLIAAIQDFITGAYLLTQKDQFLSRSQASQLIAYMSGGDIPVTMPAPAIVKPVALWTGKQIASVMLKTNKYAQDIRVTVEKKTRASYKPSDEHDQTKSMCPNDGYLVIYNSELICGTLDKASTGDGSKSTIFYIILRDYGKDAAAEAMLRLAKLTSYFLHTRGFSIGIGDVSPSQELQRKKALLVRDGYAKCDKLIAEMHAGELEPLPGSTVEGTLEAQLTTVLSDIRKEAGSLCKQQLPRFNAPVVMARCGSKGSDLNMSQMIACVGQQTLGGNRIPAGFENRTLPHFERGSADPNAKGFVSNSFFSGLTPSEFFFHTMCGREGLVDTAVKTAETGYMSRRLMKALEDLSTDYDLRVQNSSGTMVQFCYGDDGLDPAGMEGDGATEGMPVNLEHLWALEVTALRSDAAPALYPFQIRASALELLRSDDVFREIYASPAAKLRHSNNTSTTSHPSGDGMAGSADDHFFMQQIARFVEDKCVGYEAILRKFGRSIQPPGPGCAPPAPLDATNADDHAIMQLFRITHAQLARFLHRCAFKYAHASIEPGSAVGAVGAQSIGEPGTQMTLKTFHFAGIAAMNITQGVPRIKEIINASKNISTPVITAPIAFVPAGKMAEVAQVCKARVERCLLKDITISFTEVFTPDRVYVTVHLDLERIQRLRLEIDMNTVIDALLSSSLKLKHTHIEHDPAHGKIRVFPPATAKSTPFYALQTLRDALPNVIVRGDKNINRVIIQQGKTETKLLVEGTDMRAVMGTRGIVGTAVVTNHLMDAEACLGIEAARATIIREIQTTMSAHGMTIDSRHVMLLADLMTFKGEILGITRFGIAKMKSSTFMLASFEKTTDHLFDAALHGNSDPISGVSECIILGKPMKIGTGLFDLVHGDTVKVHDKPVRRNLLFEAYA